MGNFTHDPSIKIAGTMQITLSTAQDRPAMLALFAEAQGSDLSEEERSRTGFVQGRMDETVLARFQADLGVYVARDGSVLAGLWAVSTPAPGMQGPPAEMIKAVQHALPEMPLATMFMSGPIAVARHYQGQGIMSMLLHRLCEDLRGRYALGVSFVEAANHKSLAVHRHYGMQEVTTFLFAGRQYLVFAFRPDELGERRAAAR